MRKYKAQGFESLADVIQADVHSNLGFKHLMSDWTSHINLSEWQFLNV